MPSSAARCTGSASGAFSAAPMIAFVCSSCSFKDKACHAPITLTAATVQNTQGSSGIPCSMFIPPQDGSICDSWPDSQHTTTRGITRRVVHLLCALSCKTIPKQASLAASNNSTSCDKWYAARSHRNEQESEKKNQEAASIQEDQ